jgi:2-alkyl-3-oxoalkanoate reductase
LVTGATGLVGSHVVDRLTAAGYQVRVLIRNASQLVASHVEVIQGDITNSLAVSQACNGINSIVHCAAKVGDWGPAAEYRAVNVTALKSLLEAARAQPAFRRFVHVSSLGVYEARDHYGTDEATPVSKTSIDGYTLSKVEAEELVRQFSTTHGLSAVSLRPGFIYGPRDRTVLPRVLDKLRTRQFAYLGSPDKLMNNTFVGNLVSAIMLALEKPEPLGPVYNVTDGRLVSKREFIETIATAAGLPLPQKIVPLGIAKPLAGLLERIWKLLGKKEAPLLSQARIKFLGYNLDFAHDKARDELGYRPELDFTDAMKLTINWFSAQKPL